MRTCVAIMVLAAACGGGVEIDELDGALLDALCSRFVRCGVIDSEETCREQLRLDATVPVELRHAVENGTVRYDGGKMDDCLDAFAEASCDETAASARVDPQECDDAIRGTVADGGACMISAQCLSQRCDNANCPDACCEGTCAPTVPEAPIGTACMPGTINCVTGSFCNSARMCQGLLAVGNICQADAQCDYGLHCQSDIDRCAEAPHRGDACPDRSCADIGAVCDASNICVALPKRGEACSLEATRCQVPNICNRTTLICEPPPALGQPCNGSCESGLYCDTMTGVCAARKPDGEACQRNSECSQGSCDDNNICGPDPFCV